MTTSKQKYVIDKSLPLADQKLSLEINQLENPTGTEKASKFIPVISSMITVLGFFVGLWQYHEQQVLANQALLKQQDTANKELLKQQAVANKDFLQQKMKQDYERFIPFSEKQIQLYFEASEAAATIATSSDADAKSRAKSRFWILYWGPLAIVEDAGVKTTDQTVVKQSMVNFGHCLNEPGTCTVSELKIRSLNLAYACRESLANTSDVRFANLKQDKK